MNTAIEPRLIDSESAQPRANHHEIPDFMGTPAVYRYDSLGNLVDQRAAPWMSEK
jgi:hypothetical protein